MTSRTVVVIVGDHDGLAVHRASAAEAAMRKGPASGGPR